MTRFGLLALPLIASACFVQTPDGRLLLPVGIASAPPQAPSPAQAERVPATRPVPNVGTEVAAAGSEPPMSAVVEVSFFGLPLADARDVVFVLDRSGSMRGVSAGASADDLAVDKDTAAVVALGGTISSIVGHGPMPSKMDAAKAELVRTLRSLPDGTRFNVIFFNDRVAALGPTLMILDGGTRAQAEAFIRKISPSGSTAAVPALRKAYQGGARRVVLLSDGLPNAGGDARALLEDARAQIVRGVRFDTVGVGLDENAALLRTLASESGGLSVSR